MDERLVADLEAAKALIVDPSKWIRGSMTNYDGCYCAMGAVKYGLQLEPGTISKHPALRALERALPEGSHHVPLFNDHPDTTHADIMALFDRAIASAKAA